MIRFKHLPFIAVVFFAFSASGQESEHPGRNFQKGRYIVGLNGTGGFNNNSHFRHPIWSLSPWAGYFVAPNLATGLRMSYGKDAIEVKRGNTGSIPEHRYHSLAPEVFIRYYTPRVKIKPFVQVSAGYNFQWGESENTPGQMTKVKASNAVGSVEGGIRFPIAKRFSLDAAYNWRAFSKSTLNDVNEKGTWRLGMSFSW